MSERVGGPPLDEAGNFFRCALCGGYVDMRDWVWLEEHQQPLPHPACFLTIAVFSIGILFSSRYHVQTTQNSTTEKTQQAAAERGEPKAFWETATTDPVAAFTLCLVFVGGLQAYLFLKQLVIIRISLDEAKLAGLAATRTAKATEDAVELSRQTAERQLRAYVQIVGKDFLV